MHGSAAPAMSSATSLRIVPRLAPSRGVTAARCSAPREAEAKLDHETLLLARGPELDRGAQASRRDPRIGQRERGVIGPAVVEGVDAHAGAAPRHSARNQQVT